ncbi:hypothetical protein CALCODRAFT_300234 [Calocera cornea HHB12733]|uniref:Membrane magnesium transporter n=1 Tax=Calocera cornea HHB12733 TaxID=1353952 RepID=A0A165FKC5_9BASI|nr:hypothetical protein CALCODRAFT_300234 [Calocera cornea HHB12733]
MSTSTNTTGRILLAVAVIGLLHSAFSSYECSCTRKHRRLHSYRYSDSSKLKAAGAPAQFPTIDVIAEAMLSLLTFIVGAALWTPPLKPNTWASEMAHRTIDQMDTRIGFVTFGHRGKYLPGKGKS